MWGGDPQKAGEAGLDCDFIHLEKGCSRINVKLKNYDGTEINGRGPEAGEEEFNRLLGQLDSLEAGDGLVLAGSLAAGLPSDTYGRILDRIAGRGILTAVDTAGRSLLEALKGRPFLIKPNRDELEELFEERADEPERLASLAGRLQDMGARNVLVSLGGDGAFLLDEEKMGHRLGAPKGRLENSVGAGDSMVAGFLAGWLEKGSYSHAFAMGVAAGSASASCRGLRGERRCSPYTGGWRRSPSFRLGVDRKSQVC